MRHYALIVRSKWDDLKPKSAGLEQTPEDTT
jgi:hypothetical protein